MNWLKKHWDDPITVGSYAKVCCWSVIVWMIYAIIYILYVGVTCYNWQEKVIDWVKAILYKIKRA